MAEVLASGSIVLKPGESLTVGGAIPLTFELADPGAAPTFDGSTVKLHPGAGGSDLNSNYASGGGMRLKTLRWRHVGGDSGGSSEAYVYTLLDQAM